MSWYCTTCIEGCVFEKTGGRIEIVPHPEYDSMCQIKIDGKVQLYECNGNDTMLQGIVMRSYCEDAFNNMLSIFKESGADIVFQGSDEECDDDWLSVTW